MLNKVGPNLEVNISRNDKEESHDQVTNEAVLIGIDFVRSATNQAPKVCLWSIRC